MIAQRLSNETQSWPRSKPEGCPNISGSLRKKGGFIINQIVTTFSRPVLGLCLSLIIWSSFNTLLQAQPQQPARPTQPTAVKTTPVNPTTGLATKPAPAKPLSLQQKARIAAEKYGVPPKLFYALIRQESGWDYKSVSYVGALGLTQIMPFNVKAMGYRLSRFKTSPVAQLECGARMLRSEFNRFGRWDYALAAYNAGGGAVIRYGGIPPYSETVQYVRNIMYMANHV